MINIIETIKWKQMKLSDFDKLSKFAIDISKVYNLANGSNFRIEIDKYCNDVFFYLE